MTQQRGDSPLVTLLREDGSGRNYVPPADAYVKARGGNRGKAVIESHRYFKINGDLWLQGHLQALSGPALLMLLIILAERGGDGEPVWFSTEAFPERYGISSATRTKGVRELEDRWLLDVERRSMPPHKGAEVFGRRRLRHVYRLTEPALVDDDARRVYADWLDRPRTGRGGQQVDSDSSKQ